MITTSTLTINFNQLSEVTGAANNLSKKLSKRINDYSGIKRNISDISTSRNNLSQSNYYINKKIQKLQEKADKLKNFSTDMTNFRDEAKEADVRVAKRIRDDTNSFKKINKLHISVFSYIGAGLEEIAKKWFGRDIYALIKSGVRNIKYEIKDWYHERGGKYYVGIVKDLVAVSIAVAIVAGLIATGAGVAAIFFAGFAVYNSAADVIYDIAASKKWNDTNNKALADRLDDSGGRELTRLISGGMLEGIAILFNQNRQAFREAGEAAGGLVYGGVQIASILYGINSFKNFIVGKEFSFKEFYNALKKNAQNGSLTMQDVFIENVKSESLMKMYKDYKIQSTLISPKGIRWEMISNAFKTNYITYDWDSFENVSENIKSIKDFIKDGVMGKKTYLYPIKFEEQIKKSIKGIKNTVRDYNPNATRITPLQI